MKIISKEIFPLKNGRMFVTFQVCGKENDSINLQAEGLHGKAIFFHEQPKTMNDCGYCPDEDLVILGGSKSESMRTIFLIIEV